MTPDQLAQGVFADVLSFGTAGIVLGIVAVLAFLGRS